MRRVMVLVLALGCTDLTLEPYAPPATLEVGPENQIALTGEPFQLELRMYDADGRRIPIPGWTPVHWSTDDPTVTVHDGQVVGSRGSIARVTASAAGLSDGAVIRINPAVLDVEIAIALSQAVQDPLENIPLISGRDVIFRAFVTSEEVNYYDAIDLQATFRLRGSSFKTPVLSLGSTEDGVPKKVVDDFGTSYFHEIAIAGAWIEHGTVLEIELDPDGRLDPRLNLDPKTAVVKLPVIDVPVHRQMLVPSMLAGGTTAQILEVVESVARDSLALMRSIFPINELDVEIHDVFRSDANLCRTERDRAGHPYPAGWVQFINEIETLRLAEGRRGWHYVGLVTASYLPPVTAKCPPNAIRLAGIANMPGFTAAAIPPRWALIHELGHNLNLSHAPCSPWGISGVDPDYPYEFGVIGNWGFDILNEEVHGPETSTDIMGYCFTRPQWISAYHFEKARRWRSGLRSSSQGAGDAALVWGTVTSGGIDLEPSFRVNTDFVLPSGMGDYTLSVVGPDSEVLYESRFTPAVLSEGGASHFSFAIPYVAEIERIEVLGPEGLDVVGRGTEAPVAMWWRGDEVVGIQRDWSPGMAFALEAGTRVVVSQGVPR